MSLFTAATYRNNKMLQQHTSINKHLQVVMYMQRSRHFCSIHTLMMAQDRVESTRLTISYGSFINQFPLDTIKSIRQLERTFTKICRQNISILFNEICINEEMLPKKPHTHTHTHTHTHLFSFIISAYIPAPILFGNTIDTACLLWRNRCGNNGILSCLWYCTIQEQVCW